MGLLSKLFGKTEEDKKALDLFENLLKAGNENSSKPSAAPAEEAPRAEETKPESAEPALGPAGCSWGELMPDEPNQYNFKGTWQEYFEDIFNTEFAAYRWEREEPKDGRRRLVYTFYAAAGKALIVEVMPSASEAKKLRERCGKEGTPYLRYYYDYEGWWNTRSYVVERTRNALKF